MPPVWYKIILADTVSVEEVPYGQNYIQSNLNGSNTFGTMEIRSRHGYLEPLRVIMAPVQKANSDDLGKSFRFSTQ